MYDKIANGQIVEADAPDFDSMTPAEIAALGWVPRRVSYALCQPGERWGPPIKSVFAEHTDWNYPAVAPSLAEAQAESIARINSACRNRIYAKYSRETQQSAVLGIYGQVFLDTMKDEIASMIQTSNAACDAVNAATTVQAAAAAEVVTWPL